MTILIGGKTAAPVLRTADTLIAAGYTVETAWTAEEILARMERGGVDLAIITEPMLPDAYGDALLKAINKDLAAIPVFGFFNPQPPPGVSAIFPGQKDFPEDPSEEGRSLHYFLNREGYTPHIWFKPPVKPKELVIFVRRVLSFCEDES